MNKKKDVFWVVVLGDIGRSPRMQYHALSLSKKPNVCVHLIGYEGAAPNAQLLSDPNVQITHIDDFSKYALSLPNILRLVLKAVLMTLSLLWLMLVKLPAPTCILMQTPPAVPTMAVAWVASWWHQCRLIVDWHNYGFTLLAMNYGPDHPFVHLAHWYEGFWSTKVSGSFCVTRAMQEDMTKQWGVSPTVLYDRPPKQFLSFDLATTHNLFVKLASSLNQPGYDDFLTRLLNNIEADNSKNAKSGTEKTVTTFKSKKELKLADDRPAVIISSTSWTPDEDFQILLDAAVAYESKATSNKSKLPKVLILITGKGPQKDMFIAKIQALKLTKVAFRTLWLEAEDYPLLLASADVGVSLHASSSGLDLPMKVVDMFGAGLPVCALSFNCIDELITDGKTGLLFKNSVELSEHFSRLFERWPNTKNSLLERLKSQVAQEHQNWRWEDNWDKVAWPVISGAS